MEIEDESKKIRIICENLPVIFSKEIEKLIKCIDEIKEDVNVSNQKLLILVDKLENSIQQYELVFHESENCRNLLNSTIGSINEKILIEIFKIKNPNETIYELMKIFFLLLSENTQNTNITWLFLQSNFNYNSIKHNLQDLLIKDISKDLIDQSMPFNLKHPELKISLSKINKNLVNILDLVKYVVDYNIKKNIVKNLYNSNLNKNAKLNVIKESVQGKEILIKEASEYIGVMQSELTTLLTQKNSVNFYKHIVNNYDFAEKYKIFIEGNSQGHIQLDSRPKVTIKLKGKYKSREDFVRTILEAKDKNQNNPFTGGHSSNAQVNSLPKLKLPRIYTSTFENTATRSRNIHNNIYTTNPIPISTFNNPLILSNGPSKVYYTSERAKRDNLSISLKQRSLGSTIYKDIETLENIIKDEKSFDVIPLNHAIKPTPKQIDSQYIGEGNKIKNNKESFIFDLGEDSSNPEIKGMNIFAKASTYEGGGNVLNIIPEDEKEVAENNQNIKENKKIISILDEYKKENEDFSHSHNVNNNTTTPNILRIESRRCEYPRSYFCCK